MQVGSYGACPLVTAYLTENHVLRVHPCCSMRQSFLPFKGRILFHCLHRPHLVYPLIGQWTLVLLPPSGSRD